MAKFRQGNIKLKDTQRTYYGDNDEHSIWGNSTALYLDGTAWGSVVNLQIPVGENTTHREGDGSDHADVDANTSASHTQDTDIALGSGAVAADHGAAATDQIVNVCYGEGAPPDANTTTIGSLYFKHTA